MAILQKTLNSHSYTKKQNKTTFSCSENFPRDLHPFIHLDYTTCLKTWEHVMTFFCIVANISSYVNLISKIYAIEQNVPFLYLKYGFNCFLVQNVTYIRKLKGQSHGDFSIFFVTILIIIYIKVPCSHMNCFKTTKGTILNEFSKQKQAKLVFRDFIWDTRAELERFCQKFQVGRHFHPGHPYPDLLIIVSMYWNTHFNIIMLMGKGHWADLH